MLRRALQPSLPNWPVVSSVPWRISSTPPKPPTPTPSRSTYAQSDEPDPGSVVTEFSSPNIAKHPGIHHLPSAAIGCPLPHLPRPGPSRYARQLPGRLGHWVRRPRRRRPPWRQRPPASLSPTFRTSTCATARRVEATRNCRTPPAGPPAAGVIGDPAAPALWKRSRLSAPGVRSAPTTRLGIEFDRYTPESPTRDELRPLIEPLRPGRRRRGEPGRLIVPLARSGFAPRMVQRSDGASLYATQRHRYCGRIHRWRVNTTSSSPPRGRQRTDALLPAAQGRAGRRVSPLGRSASNTSASAPPLRDPRPATGPRRQHAARRC